jgi:hypothetical protein
MTLGSVGVARSGSTERDRVQPLAGRRVPPVPRPRDPETRPVARAAEPAPCVSRPGVSDPGVSQPGPCAARPLAGSGRTELFVVLLIAAMGVALAGVVVFAPWHPAAGGLQRDSGTVIRLESPDRHNH